MAARWGMRRQYIADWLRVVIAEFWKVALLLAGFGAVAIGVGLWLYRDIGRPVTTEDAEIVRFGSYGNYDGDHPVVLVRLGDGRTRQLSASGATLINCRIGGRIRLLRGPSSLRVSPRGCPPPTP
jgi:hypothetical protein